MPSGSGEEDENKCEKFTYKWKTDRRRTKGDQKSSVELKICKKLKIFTNTCRYHAVLFSLKIYIAC